MTRKNESVSNRIRATSVNWGGLGIPATATAGVARATTKARDVTMHFMGDDPVNLTRSDLLERLLRRLVDESVFLLGQPAQIGHRGLRVAAEAAEGDRRLATHRPLAVL